MTLTITFYYLNEIWNQTKGDNDPRWFYINPDSPSFARATPRSWSRLSKLLDIGLSFKEDVIGSLSLIPGGNFYNWYEKARDVVVENKEFISRKDYYENPYSY